jgi:hypothetical protein
MPCKAFLGLLKRQAQGTKVAEVEKVTNVTKTVSLQILVLGYPGYYDKYPGHQ